MIADIETQLVEVRRNLDVVNKPGLVYGTLLCNVIDRIKIMFEIESESPVKKGSHCRATNLSIAYDFLTKKETLTKYAIKEALFNLRKARA